MIEYSVLFFIFKRFSNARVIFASLIAIWSIFLYLLITQLIKTLYTESYVTIIFIVLGLFILLYYLHRIIFLRLLTSPLQNKTFISFSFASILTYMCMSLAILYTLKYINIIDVLPAINNYYKYDLVIILSRQARILEIIIPICFAILCLLPTSKIVYKSNTTTLVSIYKMYQDRNIWVYSKATFESSTPFVTINMILKFCILIFIATIYSIVIIVHNIRLFLSILLCASTKFVLDFLRDIRFSIEISTHTLGLHELFDKKVYFYEVQTLWEFFIITTIFLYVCIIVITCIQALVAYYFRRQNLIRGNTFLLLTIIMLEKIFAIMSTEIMVCYILTDICSCIRFTYIMNLLLYMPSMPIKHEEITKAIACKSLYTV